MNVGWKIPSKFSFQWKIHWTLGGCTSQKASNQWPPGFPVQRMGWWQFHESHPANIPCGIPGEIWIDPIPGALLGSMEDIQGMVWSFQKRKWLTSLNRPWNMDVHPQQIYEESGFSPSWYSISSFYGSKPVTICLPLVGLQGSTRIKLSPVMMLFGKILRRLKRLKPTKRCDNIHTRRYIHIYTHTNGSWYCNGYGITDECWMCMTASAPINKHHHGHF